jgi:hypothetical protein
MPEEKGANHGCYRRVQIRIAITPTREKNSYKKTFYKTVSVKIAKQIVGSSVSL